MYIHMDWHPRRLYWDKREMLLWSEIRNHIVCHGSFLLWRLDRLKIWTLRGNTVGIWLASFLAENASTTLLGSRDQNHNDLVRSNTFVFRFDTAIGVFEGSPMELLTIFIDSCNSTTELLHTHRVGLFLFQKKKNAVHDPVRTDISSSEICEFKWHEAGKYREWLCTKNSLTEGLFGTSRSLLLHAKPWGSAYLRAAPWYPC
jgi:hypothetical protein